MIEPNAHIALIGNPNCGKTTLFNRLTGLRQKTSNLPGTTVEQKSGTWNLGGRDHKLSDLPGIYSLYTHSDEERVVVDRLLSDTESKPDVLIFVLDASNLRRNLLLYSQVAELGFPSIIALSMGDTAAHRGIKIDIPALEKELDLPVCNINPRKGTGIDQLADLVQNARVSASFPPQPHIKERLQDFAQNKDIKGLSAETLLRYKKIEAVVSTAVIKQTDKIRNLTKKLDRVFTHKLWGFLVFAFIMLTIFQGVFTLADYPMTWIENGFSHLSAYLGTQLPNTFFSRMLIEGIIPGLAGVIVFLPQIAILFFFISLLEDSGYMVRASFITDNLMRRLGLNGRSVIPMIGGFACAIPAILATRSIKNKGERIATMFVIPLMSCSARLPVYVLLVAIAVPVDIKYGPIGLQSIVMTLAYFAGIIMAVIISKIMHWVRKREDEGEFILEMPAYQLPRLENVWTTVVFKSKSFLTEAGKIIMLISLILWFLASNGPGSSMEMAEARVKAKGSFTAAGEQADIAAARLENSYAGRMGKFIEPAIAPLGYDWKTGIALISSFAAREVFVGTMNTLFPSGSEDNIKGIRAKMQDSKTPDGKPLYGAAYAFSLIIFYAFALQCVSTLAVMKRETGSWKWPFIQFLIFGAIAYVAALITYNLSSLFL